MNRFNNYVLNSFDFLLFIMIFKTVKDRMPVRVVDLASFHVFVEWCQNVPKWTGNL